MKKAKEVISKLLLLIIAVFICTVYNGIIYYLMTLSNIIVKGILYEQYKIVMVQCADHTHYPVCLFKSEHIL